MYVRFISIEDFNLSMLCGIYGIHWAFYNLELNWVTDELGGTRYCILGGEQKC